jgi:hypothetical protein
MKLPRWLVVTLLSASLLAVLGAGAWWWVTWPERTALRFVTCVSMRQIKNVNGLLLIESDRVRRDIDVAASLHRFSHGEDYRSFMADARQKGRRTLVDWILSRQRFEVCDGFYEFTVERGKIVNAKIPGMYTIGRDGKTYWID